jgi:hypothetical protein
MMLMSRSCSWCGRMNSTTVQFCEDCGHQAHASRLDCQCGRCVLGRRRAAITPAPVPLTDEIARMVATIRLGVYAPLNQSEEEPMKPDGETGTSPANAETKRTPVSKELAEAIRRMDDLLQAEFGFDQAYCILARGLIVAASNSRDGFVPPTVATATPNGGT